MIVLFYLVLLDITGLVLLVWNGSKYSSELFNSHRGNRRRFVKANGFLSEVIILKRGLLQGSAKYFSLRKLIISVTRC